MKKLLVLMMIAVMTAALLACGSNNEENAVSNNAGAQNEAAQNNVQNEANISNGSEEAKDETADQETKYPITVKDATGTEITFDKAPERIVSTSPSETEILFALGLGDKIYGVSDFDNYPEEAASKPKVGGVSAPNAEAILAATPDLVIGGISMKEDVAMKLRSLDLKLYKTEPKNVDQVLASILQIGVITNTQAKASEIVAQMNEDIRKVTEAAATLKAEDKKKVYIEFAPGWTVGKGEFMDELITMAGGINIAGDIEGWSQINEEKIIQDNPDVILFAADLVDYDTGKPLEEIIKTRSGWDKITAIQEGRLAGLDEDILSRTGPRLTQGLLQMAQGIYPGLVQQ